MPAWLGAGAVTLATALGTRPDPAGAGLDGQGYPHGLKGEAISLPARIVSVVDAYTAMTSDRPYRKALTPRAAVAEILRHAGSQFDPRVAAAFVDLRELGGAG